jgi:uncharacterized protein (DUF1501 family)
MNEIKAQIGNTAWYLTRILDASGSCDHCGRELKHLYNVVNPNGIEMTVGRGCVKRITGWTLSYAQAQQALRSARRTAEIQARRNLVDAEYSHLASAHNEVETACRTAKENGFDPLSGYAHVSMETKRMSAIYTEATLSDNLWRTNSTYTWRDYLESRYR